VRFRTFLAWVALNSQSHSGAFSGAVIRLRNARNALQKRYENAVKTQKCNVFVKSWEIHFFRNNLFVFEIDQKVLKVIRIFFSETAPRLSG